MLRSPGDQTGESRQSIETARIGRFEILEELGRGGHGIVLLAYDPTLKRQVALKVPRPEVLASREMRERFIREANAAARLTHPAIVQVYELGDAGPICYIAAEYCPGQTLAAAIRESGPFRDLQVAAKLLLTLAEAIEYANTHGVLHRDLKPANVLLVPTETLTFASDLEVESNTAAFEPKITDFGLAKLVDVEAGHTREGVLIGTPAYMAPELAQGKVLDLGATTDVYGLGTILYEMLAGRPPFLGSSDVDLLRQVAEVEPTPLTQLRRGISPDLAAICHKCLEKRPAHRYSTAANLAADLRRYLAGEPTTARPATPFQKASKWIRRFPAAAALIGVSSLAILVISVGGWVAYSRTRLAMDEALASERQSLRLNYASTMALAWRAWEHDSVDEACRLLDRCLPVAGKEDLREFSWRYLWNVTHQHAATLIGHQGDVYRVTYSPDSNWLGSAGHDHTVRLWNAGSNQLQHKLTGHDADVNGVAFSPDSRTIASASDDGSVKIWDVSSGTLKADLKECEVNPNPVFGVSFSPDGETLATGGADARNCPVEHKQLDPAAFSRPPHGQN